MKIYQLVFSPTGGTAKVADIISKELGTEIETLDLSKQNFVECTLNKDALAVIAMPSFGGRAPKTAIERLNLVRGNGAKAVVVAVYGNRAQEDTLAEMSDTAKECDFRMIAGIEAIAEHSIAHQYATGRPDEEDAKQLKEFAQKILDKINASSNKEVQIPGNHPYKKAGAGLTPKTTSACVNCKLCADKCPVGAIDQNNPKKMNKNLCIGCMRCVSICRANAKKANSMLVKTVGVALKKACSDRKENKLYV